MARGRWIGAWLALMPLASAFTAPALPGSGPVARWRPPCRRAKPKPGAASTALCNMPNRAAAPGLGGTQLLSGGSR
jgi:hypothetical protein